MPEPIILRDTLHLFDGRIVGETHNRGAENELRESGFQIQ